MVINTPHTGVGEGGLRALAALWENSGLVSSIHMTVHSCLLTPALFQHPAGTRHSIHLYMQVKHSCNKINLKTPIGLGV